MKRLLSVLLLGGIIVVSFLTVEAQHFKKRNKYWSVGGSINAMNYLGDVTPAKNPASVDFLFTKPNIGLEATKRMTPRISLRGQLFWGRLKGDDEGNPRPGHDNRNQRFINDIKEGSIVGVFDFFENRLSFKKRQDYTPYVMVGVGIFAHNPKIGINKTSFNSFDPEKVEITQATLIYGLGFRYKLGSRWDLALEIGWRNTTTDKMDGVYGSDYKSPDEFGGNNKASYDSQPEAYKLHNARKNKSLGSEKRANMKRDAYAVTGFHLSYILAGKVSCPNPKFR